VLCQIGPAIGFYSPCHLAISGGSCRSLSTFPGGVVSVVAVYADGSVIEMATIGRRRFLLSWLEAAASRSSRHDPHEVLKT
jgi:hypothetical protein